MNTTNRKELLDVIATFNNFINKKIMNEQQVSRILQRYNIFFCKRGDGYFAVICKEK